MHSKIVLSYYLLLHFALLLSAAACALTAIAVTYMNFWIKLGYHILFLDLCFTILEMVIAPNFSFIARISICSLSLILCCLHFLFFLFWRKVDRQHTLLSLELLATHHQRRMKSCLEGPNSNFQYWNPNYLSKKVAFLYFNSF